MIFLEKKMFRTIKVTILPDLDGMPRERPNVSLVFSEILYENFIF
jgi:hypothetical protein